MRNWRLRFTIIRVSVAADILRARQLLDRQESFEALTLLERAFRQAPDDPQVRSFFGLVMALERGQVRASIVLCRQALESAPERPELYVNLARVYLKAGQKDDAVQVLRDGLVHDAANPDLLATLHGLGTRHRRVVRSLPRSHPLNKYLGLAATRLGLR